MLVPLETLSGWPEAQDPTWLQTLGLLVLIPVAISAVIALLAYGPSLARASKGGGMVEAKDPLWLGAGQAPSKEIAKTPETHQQGGASVQW